MTFPRDGEFYSTMTLLGGDPDRNRRYIYCWPSDEPVCVFNWGMKPWTAIDAARLQAVLAALNHFNSVITNAPAPDERKGDGKALFSNPDDLGSM